MKFFSTLFLFLFLFSANAQDFAPIGATWHYNKIFWWPGPDLEHYTKIEAVSDTVIDGKTCVKLTKEFPLFCNNRPSEEFVYMENDTVYFYDTTFLNFKFCMILAPIREIRGKLGYRVMISTQKIQ